MDVESLSIVIIGPTPFDSTHSASFVCEPNFEITWKKMLLLLLVVFLFLFFVRTFDHNIYSIVSYTFVLFSENPFNAN